MSKLAEVQAASLVFAMRDQKLYSCFHVYTDGGLLSRNPSPHGGTMAFCFTDMDDEFMFGHYSYCITSCEADRLEKFDIDLPEIRLGAMIKYPYFYMNPTISPNITEMLAIYEAINWLPDGWSGTVFCDNEVALNRCFGNYDNWDGVPNELKVDLEKRIARLGTVTPVLLNGHPNGDEIRQGWSLNRQSKIKRPVSAYNKWCDIHCEMLREAYKKQVIEET